MVKEKQISINDFYIARTLHLVVNVNIQSIFQLSFINVALFYWQYKRMQRLQSNVDIMKRAYDSSSLTLTISFNNLTKTPAMLEYTFSVRT